MQRLFSMFPDRQPGLALIVLRLALALMLLAGVALPLRVAFGLPGLTVTVATAAALVVGFVTPISCAITIVLEIVTSTFDGATFETIHLCAVLVAFAIALLGPGAYSLDARLFGRRRVVLQAEDEEK